MEQWLFENDVYKFYTRLFTYISRDEKFHFREVEYNRGFLYYENRMIMELITNEKRIYLAYDEITTYINKNDQIENKIMHEYRKFITGAFEKGYKDQKLFPVTTENLYFVLNYINTIRYKIIRGFDKYYTVLENEGLTGVMDTGYLEIVISNYFSFNNLSEMLNCYNDLYSLLLFVSTNDYNEIEKEIENYGNSRSLVIESINVASDGIIVAVGIGLIVEAIKSLIVYVLTPQAERDEYVRRRTELSNCVDRNVFLENEQEIFDTLQMLDKYFDQLEKCNNKTRHYINQRVTALLYRIEEL